MSRDSTLPQNWTLLPLGLIAKGGVFSDGDWVESKDQDPNGDVRLIQLADVGDGYYRDRSNRFLTYQKANELNCTFLQRGDVLVARMPDPLGRSCIFPGDKKKSVTVVDVAIIRTGEGGADHKWLMYFINSPDFRSSIEELQSGTTRKRISRKNLSQIELPVPPLPDQHRIVAKIEELFTQLDAGVAALQRAQANLKRYKASVLKAACEGRLVPTEAALHPDDYEPAEVLLARILEERRAQWEAEHPGKKYKEPAKPDVSGLPELPEGWVWATVEQINPGNRTCAYGVLKPGKHMEDGIPMIRVGDVSDGVIDENELKHIDPAIAEKYKRTKLQGGEVVISLVGAIGRTAVVPQRLEGANTARAIGVIPITSFVFNHWIEIWLRNPEKIFEMTRMSHEVARKTLNLEDVRKSTVALPPRIEQHRIFSETESLLSIADELLSNIQADLVRADRLRQAILKRAFEGRLVPHVALEENVHLSDRG